MAQLLVLSSTHGGGPVLPSLELLSHRVRQIPAEPAQLVNAPSADVIFVEAPKSLDELRLFAEQIDAPLVANMVEGGSTPIVPLDDLGELGYAVVLYANAALRSAQRAVTKAYAELKTACISTNLLENMATWEERQDAVGKPFYDELEARYAS